MTLDDALDTVRPTPDPTAFDFEAPAEWAQGRALFGGLVAAYALRAMRSVVGEERRLRALLVTFAGPVESGRGRLVVERLRAGRSATSVAARVIQQGATAALVEGVFGEDRPSSIEVAAAAAPACEAPEGLPQLPFVPGVVPEFTQRFEYRLGFGAMPFSGADRAEVGGWTRVRDVAGLAREEHLVALADAWPTPVLPMYSRPAPASSLTWALELVEPVTGPAGAWYLQRLTAERASGGFASAEMKMWSADRRLAVTGRQLVAYFDRAG